MARCVKDWKSRMVLEKSLYDSIFGRVYLGHLLSSPKKPLIFKFSYTALIDQHVSIRKIEVHENPVREASLLRKFAEVPSVVNLVDEWYDKDFHILILEFCEGGDLHTVVSKTNLSEGQAKAYFRQIVDVLYVLHTNHVAYMDLSLENVLLDITQTKTKLCDFGLALDLTKERRTAVLRGKAQFIAPEAWDVRKRNNFELFQMDVWSLGIVLFLLLTSRPPFDVAKPTDNNFSYVTSHRSGTSDLLRFMRNIYFSKNVRHLLKRLLCVDPKKRITLKEVQKHPWLSE